MKCKKATIEELSVRPGEPAGLADRSTESTRTKWKGSHQRKYKKVAKKDLREFVAEPTEAQRRFWANDTHALLVVLQAMDAAGKDGTIRHVMSGVNPQGCKVEAFKQPSSEELAHDFLWRSGKVLPARGMIGIFNRSYYEEVLVARVHPELLARGKDGSGDHASEQLWRNRFEDINAFEHHLDRNGTRIVKIFLHVSRERQKKHRRCHQRPRSPTPPAQPERAWCAGPGEGRAAGRVALLILSVFPVTGPPDRRAGASRRRRHLVHRARQAPTGGLEPAPVIGEEGPCLD